MVDSVSSVPVSRKKSEVRFDGAPTPATLHRVDILFLLDRIHPVRRDGLLLFPPPGVLTYSSYVLLR